MSADLAALDRGVIEAGLTAAEAVARVEILERRVDLLTDKLAGLCRALAAASEHAGLPSEQFAEAARAVAGHGATKAERIEQLGLSLVTGGDAP